MLNRYTTLPGSVKPAEVANRLGHGVDHVIPFDKGIVVAANTGEPYVLRPSAVLRLRPATCGSWWTRSMPCGKKSICR